MVDRIQMVDDDDNDIYSSFSALASDNYDINTETPDGKNSLHSTVGICYQNQLPSEPLPDPSHNNGHLIRDIIMHSLLDIEEIRFFGNGVTNLVILGGKPRVRPGSNAFS